MITAQLNTTDSSSKNSTANIVLINAAKNGSSALVKNILDKKGDVNYRDEEGFTALHHALTHENYHLIHLLAHDRFDFSVTAFRQLLKEIIKRDYYNYEYILLFILHELIDRKVNFDFNILLIFNEFEYVFPLILRLFPTLQIPSIEILSHWLPHSPPDELKTAYAILLSKSTPLENPVEEWAKIYYEDWRDDNTYVKLQALVERKDNPYPADLPELTSELEILKHVQENLIFDRGHNSTEISPYLLFFFPNVLTQLISEYCTSAIHSKWRFFNGMTESPMNFSLGGKEIAEQALVLKKP